MSQPTKYLTDFLELCHRERIKPGNPHPGGFVLPHVTPLIPLGEKAAVEYDSTVVSLLDDFAKQDAVSLRAVESVLSGAVASVLNTKKPSSVSLADRVRAATQQVRDDLSKKRNQFTCQLNIRGARSEDLPIRFGNIRLVKSGQAQERRLVRHTKSREFRRIIRKQKDRVGAWSKPYAVVTVRAYDYEAAQVVARGEVRRALDCMNFLGEFIPYNHAWLHFPSEGDSTHEAGAVTSDDGSMALPHTATGPLGPFRFDNIKTSDARRYWQSVSKLLRRNASGTGGDAILGVIQWAGRAKVDPRREQAFLLYAIALESAILPSKKGELGYRLSLRVSRLLGGNAVERRKTIKLVSDMYNVRSKVVHSGSFAVSATELQRMRWLTTRVLRRLLQRPKYFALSTSEYESALERLIHS